MLMHCDRQNDLLGDVAAFQQPQQFCGLLDTLASDCVSAATNLTCLAVTTFPSVPSAGLVVSVRARFAFPHWPFTPRLPERLMELPVDFALPVLAKVDFRNCQVVFHQQSNSGERSAHCRRCSRPLPLSTVPSLLMEAL